MLRKSRHISHLTASSVSRRHTKDLLLREVVVVMNLQYHENIKACGVANGIHTLLDAFQYCDGESLGLRKRLSIYLLDRGYLTSNPSLRILNKPAAC